MQICTVCAFISVIELPRIPAYYPKQGAVVCFFLFYPDSSSPGYPVSVSFPSVSFGPWADSQSIGSGLHACNPCIGCPIVPFIYGGSACRSQFHICSCKSFWYANCYSHSSFTCFYSFNLHPLCGNSVLYYYFYWITPCPKPFPRHFSIIIIPVVRMDSR